MSTNRLQNNESAGARSCIHVDIRNWIWGNRTKWSHCHRLAHLMPSRMRRASLTISLFYCSHGCFRPWLDRTKNASYFPSLFHACFNITCLFAPRNTILYSPPVCKIASTCRNIKLCCRRAGRCYKKGPRRCGKKGPPDCLPACLVAWLPVCLPACMSACYIPWYRASDAK